MGQCDQGRKYSAPLGEHRIAHDGCDVCRNTAVTLLMNCIARAALRLSGDFSAAARQQAAALISIIRSASMSCACGVTREPIHQLRRTSKFPQDRRSKLGKSGWCKHRRQPTARPMRWRQGENGIPTSRRWAAPSAVPDWSKSRRLTSRPTTRPPRPAIGGYLRDTARSSPPACRRQ
jgi:hypothetical protein